MNEEYVIHRDGSVTHGTEVVGECVTGDDGLAYVEFLDGVGLPPDGTMFTVYPAA